MGVSDEIKRLHELHLAGALTDAEFEQAKARTLASPVDLAKPGSDFASDIGALRR